MILLSTASLSGYGLHRIFAFAKDTGFDGIDLAISKFDFDTWDEDYIVALSKSFGVPVYSITAPNKGLDEKKVDKVLKIATALGSQIVTFSPPHFSDSNTSWYTNYLPKAQRNTNFGICVKNVEPKFLFFIIPEYKNASLLEIKKITNDTSLDLASIEWGSGMDILKAQSILGNSIKNIYLSDKKAAKKWLLPGMAGWGISHLPIESFFMKLKTTGYNGFISLKVRPSELGAGNEKRVLQNLEYAVSYYKKHFLNFQ